MFPTKELALLGVLLACVQGYSILGFFPFPGASHHHLFGPVMSELARRGHSVKYYTPIKYKNAEANLTQILVGNYGPEVLGSINFLELGQMSIFTHINLMYEKVSLILSRVLQEPNVQALIKSEEKFDAVILESFFFQEATSALLHKFQAVGIDIVPLGDNIWIQEVSGNIYQPSYMTDYKTLLSDDLSLMERAYNAMASACSIATTYMNVLKMQKLMDKFFVYPGWQERPALSKLMCNKSMILVNKDPFLGYSYPQAPHVKLVGGLNLRPNKPLPQDIQTFMDEAKHGVIYMSLGLNMHVSKMLDSKYDIIMKVFGRLKQRVLLKWEIVDEYRTIPANVKIGTIFPQQDILEHKNCLLFITHGGILSLSETVYHGVPIIGIPFYGDQPRNMIWAQGIGIGLHLDHDNITEISFQWAIDQLINNPRYRTEMSKRSQMMRDRRHEPLDEAVYWIEHAIKYPNALTPMSTRQSLWVFHQADIFMLWILLPFITVAVMFLVLGSRDAFRSSPKIKSQ